MAKRRPRGKRDGVSDSFHTSVRGVSHDNPDGSSRQRLIRKCRPGQELLLIRDPKNKFDSDAIMVCLKGGLLRSRKQLGFLSAELAAEMAPEMDAGNEFHATASEVTGGEGFLWWKKLHGLNIQVRRTTRVFFTSVPGVTEENADGSSRQRFVRKCKPGQDLLLVRDPENVHDSNRIMVCTKDGILRGRKQLGFLPPELAAEMAPKLDAGDKFHAAVCKVTGGRGFLWWKKPFGLDIKISHSEQSKPDGADTVGRRKG